MVDVTAAPNVHDAPLFSAPPDRAIDPPPAVAVTVPPLHVLVIPGAPATTRLAGSAIVLATPLTAGLPTGLVIVKVS